MKMWATAGKSKTLKIGVIGIGITIGLGLMIHLGTVAAQQPATGQSQRGAVPTRSDGMPANFPFREPDPIAFDDHTGYVQIFDGATLNGWDGDPTIWRVEDGAIVGEHPKDKPLGNTYIAYRGFEAKDFDLKLEIKVEYGGGSGIQYRSKTGVPWRNKPPPGQPPFNLNWMMTGPQADFWYPVPPFFSVFSGQFYSENTPLGILAWRGQVAQMEPGKASRLVGNIGDRTALGGYVKDNDWNQYLIMARGGTFIQILNGQLMAVLVDDDPADSNNQSGLIGVEIENSPTKVSVRNIWIRKY
jgi:hypothetical protein